MLIEKQMLMTHDTTNADDIDESYEERNAEGKQLTKDMCLTKALFIPQGVKSSKL